MLAPTLNEDEFDRRPGRLEAMGEHEFFSVTTQDLGVTAVRQAMRRITLLETVGAFGTHYAEKN